MEELGLMDFVAAIRHRLRLFLIVFGVLLLAGLCFSFTWSRYKTDAIIEIARAEVPDSIVESKADSARDQQESQAALRVSRLQQKVLSTSSLIEIITKFDLYKGQRQSNPIAAVVDKMRRKIEISFLSGDTTSPKSDPIGFTLSYTYGDPLLAQKVANELVSRFLDEDRKESRAQTEQVSSFLDSQLKTIEESLAEQEKKIADFRSQHGDTRPDALAFNQQAAASATMSLQNLETQIATNMATLGSLRTQLVAIDPYSRLIGNNQQLTTPSAILRGLKSEYAALTGRYGPDHPDVVKTAQQIRALENQQGKSKDVGLLAAKRDDLQTQLAEAQNVYGPEHPSVGTLTSQLADIEKKLKQEQKKPSVAASHKDADNPTYLQILSQIKATEEQYKALNTQKESLIKQHIKYTKAVALNPEVEKQLAALARDYDNTQAHYRELKAKKLSADMARAVDSNGTGAHLSVIDPPEMPSGTSPPRLLLAIASLLLSIGAAFVVVIGLQIVQEPVISPGHLEALVGEAPLISLPYLLTNAEREHCGRNRIKIAGLVAALIVIALIFVSIFVMPPDVLAGVFLQRLGY